MIFEGLGQAAGRFVSANAASILTAGGVVGTVLTATLASKATVTAMQRMEEEKLERFIKAKDDKDPTVQAQYAIVQDVELSTADKLKIAWPFFVPAVAIGGLTIASIVMANRVSAKQAAMMAAAYAASEKKYADYKAKVEETLTKTKREQLGASIAQDQVNNNPPQVMIMEGPDVLCYDQFSDRYFRSTAEKIRATQNKINDSLFHHQYASLSEYYDHIGLKPTEFSNDVGWNLATTGALDSRINVVKSPDEKPCLAVEFIVPPRGEYQQNY